MASSWFWSMSILTRRTAPRAAFTACSSKGPSCLQGPHQGAQKSTMTGVVMEACSTSASKLSVLESLIRSAGGGPPLPAWPAPSLPMMVVMKAAPS
jgi:hypothetical protein